MDDDVPRTVRLGGSPSRVAEYASLRKCTRVLVRGQRAGARIGRGTRRERAPGWALALPLRRDGLAASRKRNIEACRPQAPWRRTQTSRCAGGRSTRSPDPCGYGTAGEVETPPGVVQVRLGGAPRDPLKTERSPRHHRGRASLLRGPNQAACPPRSSTARQAPCRRARRAVPAGRVRSGEGTIGCSSLRTVDPAPESLTGAEI